MLVTREEAKNKWCPMAGSNDPAGDACKAAACMMWRWHDKESKDQSKEAERRGFCGLSGDLLQNPPVSKNTLLSEEEVMAMLFDPEDFDNLGTYYLAKALADVGLMPKIIPGAIAVSDTLIQLRVHDEKLFDNEDDSVGVQLAIETYMPNHMGDGLVSLRSSEFAGGKNKEQAMYTAASEWVKGCMEPLLNSINEGTKGEPDTSYNHFIAATDNQKLFDIYNGPLLTSGMETSILDDMFVKNPYSWIAERIKLTFSDEPFHLVKFSAMRMPHGVVICETTVDGEPFEAVDELLKEFNWPYNDCFQSIWWCSVLRQLPT